MENIDRRWEEGEKKKIYGIVGYSSSEERHMRPYPSLLLFIDNQKIHEEKSSLSPMCSHQIPVDSSRPVVTQTLWFNSVFTTRNKKKAINVKKRFVRSVGRLVEMGGRKKEGRKNNQNAL